MYISPSPLALFLTIGRSSQLTKRRQTQLKPPTRRSVLAPGEQVAHVSNPSGPFLPSRYQKHEVQCAKVKVTLTNFVRGAWTAFAQAGGAKGWYGAGSAVRGGCGWCRT
eukprot:5302948-Prymnesium_polylepis.2